MSTNNNNLCENVNGTASARIKTRRPLIFAIAFAAFFALMFHPHWLIRKSLGGDDSSYIAHAFTIGLDADMDYSNESVLSWTHNKKLPSGSIGSGLLASPFVALLSILDRHSNHPVIENREEFFGSWSFFAFCLAASIYFLAGVFLYLKTFRLLNGPQKLWLVIIFCLSSGVPHFVLMRFTMSHAFEFFAGALLLWATVNLYNEIVKSDSKPFRWMCLCSVALMMSLFVRQSSYNLIIMPHLVLLILYVKDGNQYTRAQKKQFRQKFLWAIPCIILGVLPLVLYNYSYFGTLIPSGMDLYGFNAYGLGSTSLTQILFQLLGRLPNILLILFSSEWGIFYTNPVLVIGGCFLLIFLTIKLFRNKSAVCLIALIGFLLFVGFNFAIVLWWQNTGMCYGYRHLFPLNPIGMLGTALLLEETERLRESPRDSLWRNIAKRRLRLAITVICTISIISMVLYGATGELWAKTQINTYGIMQNSSGNGYMLKLPGAAINPKTWKNVLVRRYVGFTAKKIIVASDMSRYSPIGISKEEEADIINTPISIYLQASFLLLLWLFAGYSFGLYEAKRQNET
jgi:hypothetical protein